MKRKLSGLYMLLMLGSSNTLIWCLRYVFKALSCEPFCGVSCRAGKNSSNLSRPELPWQLLIGLGSGLVTNFRISPRPGWNSEFILGKKPGIPTQPDPRI
jgi:hypothetical protein